MIDLAEEILDEVYDYEDDYLDSGENQLDTIFLSAEDLEDNLHFLTSKKLQF